MEEGSRIQGKIQGGFKGKCREDLRKNVGFREKYRIDVKVRHIEQFEHDLWGKMKKSMQTFMFMIKDSNIISGGGFWGKGKIQGKMQDSEKNVGFREKCRIQGKMQDLGENGGLIQDSNIVFGKGFWER